MLLNDGWRRRNSRTDWHSAELAALVAAGVLPSGRVLDLGCGHGTESLFLAAMGWNVVGVDLDAVALKEARQRLAQIRPRPPGRAVFRRADATRYREVRSGTFDVVVERLLYANLFPDTEARRKGRRPFRRMRRDLLLAAAYALREGGVLVMRAYDEESSWGRTYDSSFASEDIRILGRHFEMRRQVAFRGLTTSTTDVADGFVTAPIELAILTASRNGRAVPHDVRDR